VQVRVSICGLANIAHFSIKYSLTRYSLKWRRLVRVNGASGPKSVAKRSVITWAEVVRLGWVRVWKGGMVEGRRKEGWRWVSASVLRPSCYVGQASPILEPCRLQNASNAPLIHMPTLRATRPHAPRRMLHLSPAWSRQSSKWAADKPNISNRHNYAHTHTHTHIYWQPGKSLGTAHVRTCILQPRDL